MFVLILYCGPEDFCTIGPFKTADLALRYAHMKGQQPGCEWKFQMMRPPERVRAPKKVRKAGKSR